MLDDMERPVTIRDETHDGSIVPHQGSKAWGTTEPAELVWLVLGLKIGGRIGMNSGTRLSNWRICVGRSITGDTGIGL